jgi:predicted DNA-binding antitoxin AbrB/MazE fold protein
MDTIDAVYEDGVFRPLEAVSLPDKCAVKLSIHSSNQPAGHPALARLLEIANRFPDNPDSPTDRAAQPDHYLYGTPKRP